MSIFAIPILLAEEFHDIAPPVDYSLIPPWLIFLGVFVLLTAIGLRRLDAMVALRPRRGDTRVDAAGD